MSLMPEVQSDVRQTEVDREFGRVTEITDYIDMMVSELESGLSKSILAQRNEGQAESLPASTPEPVRVPLAQSLYGHGSRLERVRERLASILSRIEA